MVDVKERGASHTRLPFQRNRGNQPVPTVMAFRQGRRTPENPAACPKSSSSGDVWDAGRRLRPIGGSDVEQFTFSSDAAFSPHDDKLDRVTMAPLTPPISEASPTQAAVFRIAPGGRIGPSTATVPQLFAVLEGEGVVTDERGATAPLVAGDAVYLEPGDHHKLTSASGLTVLIIEGEGLDRFRGSDIPAFACDVSHAKTLDEHIQANSFRSERHADLLSTSSPLPTECPVRATGFPRLAQLWDRMVNLQAAAITAPPDDRAEIAFDFGRVCGEYVRLRERARARATPKMSWWDSPPCLPVSGFRKTGERMQRGRGHRTAPGALG